MKPLRIDRGADLVDLIARMVGREQMLAPVLDPLDRALEAQRREARQDVLGIELAANAEAAADVALVEMDAAPAADRACAAMALPVDVRDLGGAVQLEQAGRGIVAGDRAAGLQRHAAVPADRERQLDDRMRRERRPLRDRRTPSRRSRPRCARPAGTRRAGAVGIEAGLQLVDLGEHQLGGILGEVGIVGEHHRDRLADIAHERPGARIGWR